MAKTGGWCKKLMEKSKRNALRASHGNETSVMSYCMKARSPTARSLDRQSIEDKPRPKGPVYPKGGKLPLPRKAVDIPYVVDPVKLALARIG